MQRTPPPRRGSTELAELESGLRRYVLGDAGPVVKLREDPGLLQSMPGSLAPVLHEAYLPELSETFSRASHDGPHAEALSTGLTLLALYALVYPANYPQIGELYLVIPILQRGGLKNTLLYQECMRLNLRKRHGMQQSPIPN